MQIILLLFRWRNQIIGLLTADLPMWSGNSISAKQIFLNKKNWVQLKRNISIFMNGLQKQKNIMIKQQICSSPWALLAPGKQWWCSFQPKSSKTTDTIQDLVLTLFNILRITKKTFPMKNDIQSKPSSFQALCNTKTFSWQEKKMTCICIFARLEDGLNRSRFTMFTQKLQNNWFFEGTKYWPCQSSFTQGLQAEATAFRFFPLWMQTDYRTIRLISSALCTHWEKLGANCFSSFASCLCFSPLRCETKDIIVLEFQGNSDIRFLHAR